jgi:hypothetical protein
LKIYDTQLTFMIFSCRHNAFPLFSLLCLYYITLSVHLSGLLACWIKVIVILVYNVYISVKNWIYESSNIFTVCKC